MEDRINNKKEQEKFDQKVLQRSNSFIIQTTADDPEKGLYAIANIPPNFLRLITDLVIPMLSQERKKIAREVSSKLMIVSIQAAGCAIEENHYTVCLHCKLCTQSETDKVPRKESKDFYIDFTNGEVMDEDRYAYLSQIQEGDGMSLGFINEDQLTSAWQNLTTNEKDQLDCFKEFSSSSSYSF